MEVAMMDEALHQAILNRLEDGHLSCSQAHAIAQALGVDPLVIGRAADDADVRISRCQLGLFGYGPKAQGKHKIVNPLEDVPAQLAAYLRAEAGEDGISCFAIWSVAERLGYKRIVAAGAVEAMGLRVSRCQLGCFPRPSEE
jgi:hypothetical protein